MNTMGQYWILENDEPKQVDMDTWGEWFGELNNRCVGNTVVEDSIISTVFLGIDHNLAPEGPPILFESMIFGGLYAGYQDRCVTMDEAKKMHAKHVRMVTAAGNPEMLEEE